MKHTETEAEKSALHIMQPDKQKEIFPIRS